MEQWAGEVLSSIHSTLHQLITSSVCNSSGSFFSLEDTVYSEVIQVSTMALYFHWCYECEQALLQCRYDRRALPGARGKFNTQNVHKLNMILMRNSWKIMDEVLSPLQRISLEALSMV